MQDSNLVVVSVCGLSLICVGLVGVILFLVLRFTGRTFGDFLGGNTIGGAIDSMAGVEPDTRTARVRAQAQRTPSPGNLRAQADSLDFDAAVAKYRNNPNAPSAQSIPFVPSATQPTPPPLDDSAPSLPPRKRRRGFKDEQEMDDMLGGFMDEGGDDVLPF
jgi:hypothetical protein